MQAHPLSITPPAFGVAGRRIIIGMTGGIACYKSLELCRRLQDRGADIKVVLTQGAQSFVTPLSVQALIGRAAHTSLLDEHAEAGMGHIALARWAELILIAPCTANYMAKLAQGTADDLLSTIVLASQAPVLLAPAMNQAMWQNLATQRTRLQVQQLHMQVIEPVSGLQACQDIGPGRMPEPKQLILALENQFRAQALAGLCVLITAGATQEPIDPVRFLSNHSSGRMGYALARAAFMAGAQVNLVSGPSHLDWPNGVQGQRVQTAEQMLQACLTQQQCDIIIGCAAVADLRPTHNHDAKQSKQGLGQSLELTQNPDIIAKLTKHWPKAYSVGFAAQTHDLATLGTAKLHSKNLQLICANEISTNNPAFNVNHNQVSVLSAHTNTPLHLPSQSKTALAWQLIHIIAQGMTLLPTRLQS